MKEELQDLQTEVRTELPIDESKQNLEDVATEVYVPDTNTPESDVPVQTNEELLQVLEEKLKNGRFPLIMSNKTLRSIRSFLQSKATYKGQQEAIYIATATFVVEQNINADGAVPHKETDKNRTYQFQATAIQIINYFLSKYEGTGYNSVEVYLGMAAPISDTLSQINALQKQIEDLKAEINVVPVVETH